MHIKIKLLLNKIVKALNLIPEKLRENGIVKGRIVQESLPKNKFLKLFYTQYHPVLYVGTNNEEFSTIQAAINYANDTPKYPVTIKVSPGEYNESVKLRGRRYVSLVGSDRENCVLQNNGDYWNPPLEIAGKSSVFNMTIIAVRNNDKNSKLPAYAIHHDFDGNGKSVVSNCKIISHQHSAVGIGLHNNQTLVIDNCELYSSASHGLYAHNRIKNDAEKQKLFVKDSLIGSLSGSPILLQDANHRIGGGFNDKKDTEFGFYNNNFKSGDLDESEFLKDSDPPLDVGRLVGFIKLTSDSQGNNIRQLNA